MLRRIEPYRRVQLHLNGTNRTTGIGTVFQRVVAPVEAVISGHDCVVKCNHVRTIRSPKPLLADGGITSPPVQQQVSRRRAEAFVPREAVAAVSPLVHHVRQWRLFP